MRKMYRVNVAFEGNAERSLIVSEPTERLDALVASGYLIVEGDWGLEIAETEAAQEEELLGQSPVASPRRTRKS